MKKTTLDRDLVNRVTALMRNRKVIKMSVSLMAIEMLRGAPLNRSALILSKRLEVWGQGSL